MGAKKATHEGHCQVCGRKCRLPNGVVHSHTHVVEGLFTQSCRGVGLLPLEYDIGAARNYLRFVQRLHGEHEERLKNIHLGTHVGVTHAGVTVYESIFPEHGVMVYRWHTTTIMVCAEGDPNQATKVCEVSRDFLARTKRAIQLCREEMQRIEKVITNWRRGDVQPVK